MAAGAKFSPARQARRKVRKTLRQGAILLICAVVVLAIAKILFTVMQPVTVAPPP